MRDDGRAKEAERAERTVTGRARAAGRRRVAQWRGTPAGTVVWAAALLCAPGLRDGLAAQTVPGAGSGTATVSADTVEMAEVFELRVTVPVPSGSVVYFPDTLPRAPDIESFGPVEWDADRGPENGATLTLVYPLIPFGTGVVAVPPVDIVTVPAEDDAEGERIPGGSRVGAWQDAPLSVRNTRRVVGAAVRVRPVYTAEDVMVGMSPRPPADVVGSSWSWPSIALILLFSTVLGGAVVATTREWLAGRTTHDAGPTAPPRPEDMRQRALAELDRLLAAGPHSEVHALDLYTSSSDVIRSYAEALHPEWGRELTSTELMGRLDGAGRGGAELLAEMGTAEAVKFGRLRPGAAASERHLQALQKWVGTSDVGGRR